LESKVTKLVFATSNPHKLQEIKDIAGDINIEFLLPPNGFDPIENGTTFEENSYIKAKEAAKLSGIVALADDSGLCVEALDGAPGIYSARYADTPQARINKLLNTMNKKENRRAKFVCAMTLVSPDGEIIFQTRGECHGNIAYKQAGTNGFGYDPIFLVGNGSTTMAELSETEKNKISHRGQALRNVLEFLRNKF
jgi:XTP/dITP diphosphohydrolase